MQIHQINCQYMPEEDRVLFRVNTTDEEEHRFVMTRRYMKLVLEALHRHFSSCEKKANPEKNAKTRQMISQFEHEKALGNTDLSKPFKKSPKTNTKALMLHTLNIKSDEASKIVLAFLAKNKQGIKLVFDNQMAHSILHLLEKTALQAEWDLNLHFTARAQTTLPANQQIQ